IRDTIESLWRRDLIVQGLLFDRRQQADKSASAVYIIRLGASCSAIGMPCATSAKAKLAKRVVIDMQRDAKLLKVVRSTHPTSRFARLLHRRQEKSDQHTDNGNHHPKFNQGKSALAFDQRLHEI